MGKNSQLPILNVLDMIMLSRRAAQLRSADKAGSFELE